MFRMIPLICFCLVLVLAGVSFAGEQYARIDFPEEAPVEQFIEVDESNGLSAQECVIFKAGTRLSKTLSMEWRADFGIYEETTKFADASISPKLDQFGLFFTGRF